MDEEKDTDEKMICPNCGNETFWAFRNTKTGELKLFCIVCCEHVL